MTVEFCGRVSAAGIEDLQAPFRAWVRKVLAHYEQDIYFVVVLKGIAEYASPMPRVRAVASVFAPRDILLEVFPKGETRGLSYALYLPDGVERAGLVELLQSRVSSF